MEFDVRLLGPMATACASSLATYLWILNRQRKLASLQIIRAEPLIAIKGTARKYVSVQFRGDAIESSHLLHLSLRNDGTLPITLSDYQLPFRIELNADARILDVDVLETWPADLDRRVPQSRGARSLIKTVERAALELTPVLLNPKEEIVFQVVAANYENQINVSQHINGLGRVTLWSESRLIPRIVSSLGAAIIIFAAFFLEPSAPYIIEWPAPSYIMIIIFGALLFWLGLKWPTSERTRHVSVSAADTRSQQITTQSLEAS